MSAEEAMKNGIVYRVVSRRELAKPDGDSASNGSGASGGDTES